MHPNKSQIGRQEKNVTKQAQNMKRMPLTSLRKEENVSKEFRESNRMYLEKSETETECI